MNQIKMYASSLRHKILILCCSYNDIEAVIQAIKLWVSNWYILHPIDPKKDLPAGYTLVESTFLLRNTKNFFQSLDSDSPAGVVYSASQICNPYAAVLFSWLGCDNANFHSLEQIFAQELLVPPGYWRFSMYFSKGKPTMVFTNDMHKRSFIPSVKPAALFFADGIGDFFILFELLDEWLTITDSKTVYIITPVGLPAAPLLRLLLSRSYRPTIQFYEVDNLYMMETYYEACLQTGCFSNCYYLASSDKAQVPFDIGMHQYDIYRTELFGHQKFSKSIDFDWVRHKIFDAVPPVEKPWITYQLEHSSHPNVGFQFWTGPSAQDSTRSWPPEPVAQFSDLCQGAFTLFCLTPSPPAYRNTLANMVQADFLSLFGMLYLLSQMDYFVGIDSCCGHAASFFRIPNITIWNRYQTTTMFKKGDTPLSLRPLWKNFSMEIDENTKYVPPDIAFQVLCQIHNGQIQWPDRPLTYRDSLNGLNIRRIYSADDPRL